MKKLLPAIILFCTGSLFAQDWVEMMSTPGTNFYDIQNAFNQYWSSRDINTPGAGYKVFKRWEYFMEPRVYPTGDLTLPSNNWKNFQEFLVQEAAHKNNGNNQVMSSIWQPIGPMGAMSGVAENGLPRKAGRDNFLTFHPGSNNTLWVGAPAGGLWKTTNGGTSWSTNTDLLQVIGCSDLAIDPTNPNIMYLATGDGDAGDTYSIGVLKSTDGGLTWNATGLVWSESLARRIRRLLVHPTNPQIVIAATSIGIQRSTDGGTTWNNAFSGSFFDMEFKPGNPNVIYASGTSFIRSTNAGANWTTITTGYPAAANLSRMEIAVTPNDTNYVYLVAAKSAAGSYALEGVRRSTDGGTTFTSMATSPDLLANSCSGTSGNAQGWFDLCIAVSNTNKNEVVIGGVNVWRSTNGGTSWTCIGCWNSTAANPPYIHADHHDLAYHPVTNVLYSANDGGIYYYTGSAWTDITAQRNIAQIYKIGTSSLSANKFITGHQDNGTNIYNGVTYAASFAGDGMDCFIDRTNDNNLFACRPNGAFYKSTNNGSSWTACQTGMSGTGGWVSPWKQDPVTATTLYAGRTEMFKSTNSGTNWTQLTAMGGSGTITEFAIAPSNNQVIYALKGTGIYKTTDGGSTWTNITAGVPTSGASPTFVTIDPNDANNAWVTLSGYSSGNKVFMTTNGGTNWTNVTSNLPNLPANCSVYHPGSNDGIYIGMDVGVYYKDNSMSNWILYNTGLPNTPVFDMEISPANPTKIRAATYGRGVWEVDVYTAAPPVSNFSFNTSNNCAGQAISFTDLSTNSPSTWTWSTNPSTGVTINTASSQNPTITFASAGTYTVTLNTSNGAGPGTPNSQTITIAASPTVNITNNNQTVCAGTPVSFTASGAGSYSWSAGGGSNATATYTPSVTGTYTVTGTSAGCSATAIASVTVNPLPTINVSPASPVVCIGNSISLTASGASTYSWSNGGGASATASYTPTATTTYTVTGQSAAGCAGTKTVTVTVNNLPTVTINTLSNPICNTAGPQSLSGTPAGGTFSGTGVSGGSFDPSALSPGSYTIYYNYTDANNCSNIDSTVAIVQNCVGIQTHQSANSIIVYPNPANDEVWVKSTLSGEVHIEIYDVVGKLVIKKQSVQNGTATKIDIKTLQDGVYFVKVASGGINKTIRLIKQ